MTFVQIAKEIYTGYCNNPSVASQMHRNLSNKSFAQQAAMHTFEASENESHAKKFVMSKAQAYGCTAARAPVIALKVVDYIVGTGRNSRGPVDIDTTKKMSQHLLTLLKTPADTGLMGLANAMKFAPMASLGAVAGALIGGVAAVGQSIYKAATKSDVALSAAQTVEQCATTGALLGVLMAAIVGVPAILLGVAMVGLLRLGTAVTKLLAAYAFFGAGFIAGACVAGSEILLGIKTFPDAPLQGTEEILPAF